MTALVSKDLTKSTMGIEEGSVQRIPDDIDLIPSLDYEELEQKYQIRKQHPRLIQNCDFTTPQIRAMICDKPIYAKANRPKNRTTSKKRTTDFDTMKGELIPSNMNKKSLKFFERGLRKDLKRENIHEQATKKKENRDNWQAEQNERMGVPEHNRETPSEEKKETRRLLREHHHQRKRPENLCITAFPERPNHIKLKVQPQIELQAKPPAQPQKYGIRADTSTDLLFKNPFDSTQLTLVAATSNQGSMWGFGSSSKSNMNTNISCTKKMSLSGRLKDLILSKRPGKEPVPELRRPKSFDQTKSGMTTERGTKHDLLRLAETRGRTMSEGLRTYFFCTIHL
ncbi:hypothetical protein JCM33374_g127 [Metschnikowia sp. JCM 33374]|nr:hypothetical protein JCM33374_g127 [Metschnikowia sp. JCM 33374]